MYTREPTSAARGTRRRKGQPPPNARAWALALACVLVALWAQDPLALRCPSWVRWQERTLTCDLDGDGHAEQVRLAARRLVVDAGDGTPPCATERAWRVSDALAADVNADGLPELVMLVWRRGNYGTSRPFWERGVDVRMTQHLYVMGLRDGTLRPVWMSHELGPDMEVAELRCPAPGRLELLTRQGARSTWEWSGFGFWRDI